MRVVLTQSSGRETIAVNHISKGLEIAANDSTCIKLSQDSCPKWEAFACDSAGCKCLATGQAPRSFWGDLLISSVVGGAVKGGGQNF